MKKLLTFFTCFMLSSSLAWAQSESSSEEEEPDTLVLSDTLDYDDKNKVSIFSGNVIVTRGLMRLTADRLDLSEDQKGVRQGVATVEKGKLVHILQEQPEDYVVIKSYSIKAHYNDDTEILRLLGDANVTRYVCGTAVDTVAGEEVIYNAKDATYSAVGPSSQKNTGRVRSLAQPRNRVDKLTEECQKKYKGKPMPSTIQSES